MDESGLKMLERTFVRGYQLEKDLEELRQLKGVKVAADYKLLEDEKESLKKEVEHFGIQMQGLVESLLASNYLLKVWIHLLKEGKEPPATLIHKLRQVYDTNALTLDGYIGDDWRDGEFES